MELLAGGVLGLLAGFVAGRITERTRRTRVDYVLSRKAVPGLRKIAWGNLERAIRTWAIVLIIVAAFIVYLVKAR